MYKEFIKEKEFNGSLGYLIEEIAKAFVNEEISEPKSIVTYYISGVVTSKEYGDFSFNTGIEADYVLEETAIKFPVRNHIYDKIGAVMLYGNIKGTYTLAYS